MAGSSPTEISDIPLENSHIDITNDEPSLKRESFHLIMKHSYP